MEVTAGRTIFRKTLFKIQLMVGRYITKLFGVEFKVKRSEHIFF